MSYRKLYAYAYPTSPRAVALGHGKTGCYYIERETRRETVHCADLSRPVTVRSSVLAVGPL